MAVFALVAATLLATFNGGAADLVGHFQTSSLTCDAQGFAPTFEYSTQGENQEFKFDVILGNGNGNCTYDAPGWIISNTTAANHTVGSKDFTGDYSARFPYKESNADFCGGSFKHINDSGTDKIEYNVTGNIVLYRKFRSTVVRKVQYDFEILCHMERDVLFSDDDGYNVSAVLQSTGGKDEKKGDFTFKATLELTDSGYSANYSSLQTYTNDEDLYLQVKQDGNQGYFMFSVEECYATSGSESTKTGVDKDVFIDNKCPVDETTITDYPTTEKYTIQTMAFTFFNPTDKSAAIHFHCMLKVCLTSDNSECHQKETDNGCTPTSNNMRKRRAIEYDDDVKLVSASTPVFLKGSNFQAPVCKEGSVFDRVIGTCSRKNILEIRGIRLSNDIYNPEYANTSSVAFKEMAYTKEYQLWVLVKASNNHRVIEGIKIIRARPGSVVLDVLVKHTENVLPEEAFEVFEKAMSTPASTTRVQNILQIKQGTTQVEFIPIVLGNDKSNAMDSEKLILIVVLVVLFCVVFVAAGALFKVRNNRQSSPTPRGSGFDNKGVDA